MQCASLVHAFISSKLDYCNSLLAASASQIFSFGAVSVPCYCKTRYEKLEVRSGLRNHPVFQLTRKLQYNSNFTFQCINKIIHFIISVVNFAISNKSHPLSSNYRHNYVTTVVNFAISNKSHPLSSNYRHNYVTTVADNVLLLFILFLFLLFTVRSRKLLDRFSPNFLGIVYSSVV